MPDNNPTLLSGIFVCTEKNFTAEDTESAELSCLGKREHLSARRSLVQGGCSLQPAFCRSIEC
jgi:hypothetical protein